MRAVILPTTVRHLRSSNSKELLSPKLRGVGKERQNSLRSRALKELLPAQYVAAERHGHCLNCGWARREWESRYPLFIYLPLLVSCQVSLLAEPIRSQDVETG